MILELKMYMQEEDSKKISSLESSQNVGKSATKQEGEELTDEGERKSGL